jgi:hypothetical protein
MLKPRLCPFCHTEPKVIPSNPEMDGNAWGAVQCVNQACPARPRVADGSTVADERGSDAYKALAIRRWGVMPDTSQEPTADDLRWLAGKLGNEYEVDHLRASDEMAPEHFAAYRDRCARIAAFLLAGAAALGRRRRPAREMRRG